MSHFVTLNKNANKRGQHVKKLPYVFTEQGIYMIATILKNNIATKQSIYIMRSFKEMKHYLAENKFLLSSTELSNIKYRLDKHDSDINKIMDNFVNEDKIKEKVFLDGEIFDAVETYIQIYKLAYKSIYIIDNFINIKTLGLLKHKRKNIDVTIFTTNSSKDKLRKLDVDIFNKQYPSLLLKYTNKVHDRFIITDYKSNSEKIYICGTSSKDAGYKICTITRLYNSEIIHTMMDGLLKSKDYKF